MRRFLVRDAADPKTMTTIYSTVVLYVLLYGSESWVLTSDLMRQLHRRCCRGLTGEFIRQDEEGEWICPKSEEVLKKAGVLMILEEYIQRRRDMIMKYAQTRDKYGKCKSSQKIASNLLWWEVNYNSNDAAEALMSQAPDG
jgi:monoamine oxidase